MATVTIGLTDYTAYKSLAEADEYFNGSTLFDDWDALTEDEKKRGLVSGTRVIDRQLWQGEVEVEGQDLAFPRTGVKNCSGEDVTAAETLADAGEASLILALDLANGGDAANQPSTEDLTQTLKAGSVMITKFRANDGTATRFSTPVMELVGCYFAGSTGAIAGSLSYGTDAEAFDGDFSTTEGII